MKTQDVIDLALASGLSQDGEMFYSPSFGEEADVHISDLEYFAKRVAAKEREACAQLCRLLGSEVCHDAIKAREKPQRPVKSYTNGEPQYATQATGEPWLGSPDHCSLHPDAPHGYDRSASLNEHRYVCRCEGWIPNVSTKPQNVYTSEERVHESDKSIHEEIERLKAEIKRANELAEYRLKLLMQMPENKPWDTSDMAYRPNGLSVEQEPVGWFDWDAKQELWVQVYPNTHGQPLYAAPPSKPWVGLTDEEILSTYEKSTWPNGYVSWTEFAITIEAKLKERNT